VQFLPGAHFHGRKLHDLSAWKFAFFAHPIQLFSRLFCQRTRPCPFHVRGSFDKQRQICVPFLSGSAAGHSQWSFSRFCSYIFEVLSKRRCRNQNAWLKTNLRTFFYCLFVISPPSQTVRPCVLSVGGFGDMVETCLHFLIFVGFLLWRVGPYRRLSWHINPRVSRGARASFVFGLTFTDRSTPTPFFSTTVQTFLSFLKTMFSDWPLTEPTF